MTDTVYLVTIGLRSGQEHALHLSTPTLAGLDAWFSTGKERTIHLTWPGGSLHLDRNSVEVISTEEAT